MKPIRNSEHGLEVGVAYKTKVMPKGFQRLMKDAILEISSIYKGRNGVFRVDYKYVSNPELFTRDYDEVLRGVIL